MVTSTAVPWATAGLGSVPLRLDSEWRAVGDEGFRDVASDDVGVAQLACASRPVECLLLHDKNLLVRNNVRDVAAERDNG